MRVRLTITTVVEYEVDPINYQEEANKNPEDITFEDVKRIDEAAAEDDPALWLEDPTGKTTVLVEKIG